MNFDNDNEGLKKNNKTAHNNSTTNSNNKKQKTKKKEENELLSRKGNLQKDQKRPFRLVLSHNPDSCDVIKYFDVDMVVSGHTHGIDFLSIFFDCSFTQILHN
jgi:predicted MPP superfamily phosphohydrolase